MYKNVCDYCGNEETIDEGGLAFIVHFSMLPAYEQIIKDKRHPLTPNKASFCGRDCYCEWIKEHLRKDGMLRDDED